MNKRFLALLMSLVFAFSMTVSAAASAPTGNQVVDGEGEVVYVDTEVYSVILPTAENFTFQLDPQGLLVIEDGDEVDLKDLVGGRVIGNSDPAPFVNNSSVPILLSASAAVVLSGASANVVDTKEDVEADTDTNIALYVVPSTTDMYLVSEDSFGFVAASEGFLLTATPAAMQLDFALPAADYTVKTSAAAASGYEVNNVPGTGHGNSLSIGGYINSKADWTAFAGSDPEETISVEFVFSYAKDPDAENQDIDNRFEAYGLVSGASLDAISTMAVEVVGGGATYESSGFIVGDDTQTTLSTSWDRTANATKEIPFYVKGGSSKFTKLTWNNGAKDLVQGDDYTIDFVNNKLILKKTGAILGPASASTTTAKTIGVVTDDETCALAIIFST